MKWFIIAVVAVCLAEVPLSSAAYVRSGWRPSGKEFKLPTEESAPVEEQGRASDIEITNENITFAGELGETTTTTEVFLKYLPPAVNDEEDVTTIVEDAEEQLFRVQELSGEIAQKRADFRQQPQRKAHQEYRSQLNQAPQQQKFRQSLPQKEAQLFRPSQPQQQIRGNFRQAPQQQQQFRQAPKQQLRKASQQQQQPQFRGNFGQQQKPNGQLKQSPQLTQRQTEFPEFVPNYQIVDNQQQFGRQIAEDTPARKYGPPAREYGPPAVEEEEEEGVEVQGAPAPGCGTPAKEYGPPGEGQGCGIPEEEEAEEEEAPGEECGGNPVQAQGGQGCDEDDAGYLF